MNDDDRELHDTLERLHEQLGEAHDLDEELRAELRQALDDIGRVLDRREEPADDDQSLADRLAELTQHFERSHPTLAETFGRAVNMLANLGI